MIVARSSADRNCQPPPPAPLRRRADVSSCRFGIMTAPTGARRIDRRSRGELREFKRKLTRLLAIPHVPICQWVFPLPIALRLLLVSQPELVTLVLQVVKRVLTRHLLEHAGPNGRLRADEGHSGADTLIRGGDQRPTSASTFTARCWTVCAGAARLAPADPATAKWRPFWPHDRQKGFGREHSTA